MATFPTPWLKIMSGEISVSQQEHVGNLAVIELLRGVLGRAAAPAEAPRPKAFEPWNAVKIYVRIKNTGQKRNESNPCK